MTRSEAGKLGALKSAKTNKDKYLARVSEYYQNPLVCPVCSVVIPYEKRHDNVYCSSSCAAKRNNHVYPKRKKKSVDASHVCKECGKQLDSIRKVFCGSHCANVHRYNEWVRGSEALGEFLSGSDGEANRRCVKRYLVNTKGRACAICGITEWMGKPAPLIVDHIDGDSTNNRIDNFRLVCGNCDMQLPTYKSKNKKGREWRRKYYSPKGESLPLAGSRVKFAKLSCPQCGKEFTRRANNIHSPDPDRFYSCSRACAARLSNKVRRGEYTEDELLELHKNNIISIG